MRKPMTYPINDIDDCVRKAQRMMESNNNIRQKDHSLFQAFIALTGDETTGFLAYAIWRERSNLIASFRNHFTRGPEVLTTVRASLAPT